MKKIVILLVAALFSGSLPAADAPNLLKNPGFEKAGEKTPAAEWSPYRDGYALSEDNVQENGGKYSISLSGDKVNKGLYQVVYAKPGEKFEISLDMLLSRFEAGKILPLYVTIVCSDNKTQYVELISLTPGKAKVSPDYQTLSATLDLAKYPTATGTFGVWCLNMGFSGDMFIDNLNVKKLQ